MIIELYTKEDSCKFMSVMGEGESGMTVISETQAHHTVKTELSEWVDSLCVSLWAQETLAISLLNFITKPTRVNKKGSAG